MGTQSHGVDGVKRNVMERTEVNAMSMEVPMAQRATEV